MQTLIIPIDPQSIREALAEYREVTGNDWEAHIEQAEDMIEALEERNEH